MAQNDQTREGRGSSNTEGGKDRGSDKAAHEKEGSSDSPERGRDAEGQPGQQENQEGRGGEER